MNTKIKIKRTKYFIITDEIGIDHSGWLKLLNPICKMIESRVKFPIDVQFKVSGEYTFYINDRIEIPVSGNETLDEINWIICHEFRHHMQNCDLLLNKCIYNGDRRFLIKVLKTKSRNWADEYHDILPEEQDANNFASDITGIYFKYTHYLNAKRVNPPKNLIRYKRTVSTKKG